MAFNPALDQVHGLWTLKSGLQISVHSYNGGERKIQIGPRVFTKRDGTQSFGKAGRLSNIEFTEMAEISGEIFKTIEG
jgi:hypothetical protein